MSSPSRSQSQSTSTSKRPPPTFPQTLPESLQQETNQELDSTNETEASIQLKPSLLPKQHGSELHHRHGFHSDTPESTTFSPSPPPRTNRSRSRSSRPSSRPVNYYRDIMQTVCSRLYGDSNSISSQDCKDCIEKYYENGASYENALISAHGQDAIADQFCLMRSLPVTISDEICNVFESPAFDGGHSLIADHILHIYIFPSLAKDSKKWSLIPPSPEQAPTNLSEFKPNWTGLDGMQQSAVSITSTGGANEGPEPEQQSPQTLIQFIMSFLTPKAFLYTLTHFKLRILTRLDFNEMGYITLHEDVCGIKEFIEGSFPLVGLAFYPLQRFGFGMFVSFISRITGINKRKRVINDGDRIDHNNDNIININPHDSLPV